jgi:hypothetical protein
MRRSTFTALLPEEQRHVLLLVGLEGLSYEETAAILRIPVGTVRSRLSRARDFLCKLMGIEKLATKVGRSKLGATEGGVATENRIRAGADAAMGYPLFGMIDLLKLLGGLLVGLFRSRAAREAEMAFLRQQLSCSGPRRRGSGCARLIA